MYQTTYPASASPPYASPTDPYRSSPIAVSSRQPYAGGTFSPPPPNGFSPVPSGQPMPPPPHPATMYQPLSAHGTPVGGGVPQYSRSGQRYAPQPGPYPNGAGYPLSPGQLPVPPSTQPPMPPPQRHKGTLAPGQLIRVGENTVKIERYLSEGGYAHVYLTSSDRPIYPPKRGEAAKGRWGERGYTEHCLKRIAFEDDSVWSEVSKEIEVMKALPPSPHLVQYLDSTHSRTSKGGHEVFILMEFCAGGGIIDFLNKRLRDRLKEIEILNIFTDVCEAVAAMHALPQPLLHRDLKIENVLSHPLPSGLSQSRPTPLIFKLCDFGSTTYPASRPPASKAEADALAADLNRHTTLQYRSPEMVEPMLGWAVGLASDVWALGVLLYKLCYYTTPFEEHGTLAIVNAKYTFPQYPVYSPRLQHLIASMLVEHPTRRPNVFEVLRVAHEMSGSRPEVDYSSLASRPAPSAIAPAPRPSQKSGNLLDFTDSPSREQTPVMQPSLSSTVQPQRRGRPTREPSKQSISQSTTPLPAMPQPPTLAQSQSPAVSAPIGQSKTLPPPSIQVTGDKPRLQITGERAQPPSLSTTGPATVDAFGMPTESRAATASPSGFGDSFAAGPPKTVANTASKFGPSLRRPMSTAPGFGDSFSGKSDSLERKPSSSSGLSPKRHSSIIAPKSTSPKRATGPSSSIPERELTFEQRFPSIETLSTDDAFTPQSERPPTVRQPSDLSSMASPLISPAISRPHAESRPSFAMANRTGGDLVTSHLSAPMTSGAPQARSTQVTGTAFKDSAGANRPSGPSPSSSSVQSGKADYFGSIEAGDAMDGFKPIASPAVDIMDREDQSQLSMPLLQPVLSTSPSASHPLSMANRTTSGPPPEVSTKPASLSGSRPGPISVSSGSNINSDNWSPLEAARANATTGSGKSAGAVQVPEDSSDEGEDGPEEATGTGRRPASPVRRESASRVTGGKVADRMSMFERPAAEPTPSLRRSPTKATTIAVGSRPESIRTNATATAERERTRPQSMYAAPSSGSVKSFMSPPLGSDTSARTPTSVISGGVGRAGSAAAAGNVVTERPSHSRRSSINDIVSQYEAMHVGPGAGSAAGPSDPRGAGSGSGHGASLTRKPSVATKPAALRKPTLNTASSSTSPTKAASSGVGSGSGATLGPTPTSPSKAGRTAPKVSEKPAGLGGKSAPAKRHGDAPAPAGWSKSSSGRSFPISKVIAEADTEGAAAGVRNGTGVSGGEGPSGGLGGGGVSGNVGTGNGEVKMDEKSQSPPPRRGSSSPEKQQPVNLLIQRWNKGEVSTTKPPVKRGGYI